MGWSGGLAEWRTDDITYLSVAFTWKLDEAYSRARFAKACGQRVIAGGPALFQVKMQHELAEVAEIGNEYPEAVTRHNPDATFASRGCPAGCWFCIVPAMEGREFTLIPDFVPRPILCDNNLSGLPADFQDYIIRRYQDAGVKLRDANSGFEPRSFTPDVYSRWKPLINAGGGPWRFAYDDMKETKEALDVMEMLWDEPQKRKRVYVLIGNEPFEDCMTRIYRVIAMNCEPHVQPLMKLNALDKDEKWVRYDWTLERLQDVARWANSWGWKKFGFSEYDRHKKNTVPERYDAQQGLFV